jgi:hypothetical protein
MFTLVLLLVVLASMRGSFRAVWLPSGLDAYWYAYQETGDLQSLPFPLPMPPLPSQPPLPLPPPPLPLLPLPLWWRRRRHRQWRRQQWTVGSCQTLCVCGVQFGDLHMHTKNHRQSGDCWKGLIKAESFSTFN